MIFDIFTISIATALRALFLKLPDFNVEIPPNVYDGLHSVLANVGYVFPVGPLLPILVISLGLSLFRVTWAIVIRIKSFIPTMGA